MQKDTGFPASMVTRLTFGEAWRATSQRLSAQARRNPTINAYAHVWAQFARQAAQSTSITWSEAEVPEDPEAITRLTALNQGVSGGIR